MFSKVNLYIIFTVFKLYHFSFCKKLTLACFASVVDACDDHEPMFVGVDEQQDLWLDSRGDFGAA